MHLGRLTALAAALLVSVPPAWAAGETGEEWPRTCLVLSGGGARGAAHIGVLGVLEELHVPVDCVVGTSMGAVVGGLYASGLSAEDLQAIYLGADWRDLLNDRPPRKNIPFRRKQDDNLSLFRFEFGLDRRGIVLPSGLIAGQKLDFLLKNLTLPVAEVPDFDQLPIPFRAVATDLGTGEMVVLDRGNLAEAMRASMAVPGAFTPAEIEGRTLVDGGLVRNLPVDLARDLGAERVIAVDVTTPLGTRQAGQTVVSVAVQMIDLLTEANVREQRGRVGGNDLLLRPDLGDLGGADFERVPEAIALGEVAARQAEDKLRLFSVPEAAYHLHTESIRTRQIEEGEPVRIDEVRVTGVQRVNPRIVTARVRSRPGESLDKETLRGDLERVYEMGDFERVDFRVEREGGRNVLAIDAREKSWGPNFLRLGLDLEADFAGQGDFTILADLRRARVNQLGAEVKALATIGKRNSLYTEFYQPLGYGGIWFVSPQVELSRDRQEPENEDGTLTPFRVKTFTGRIDLGAQFRKYGEIRVGVLRGRASAEPLSELPLVEPMDIDAGGWIGRLTIDRLDNANFPRNGTFANSELFLAREYMGADASYDRLEAEIVRADSFGRHTVVGVVRYGTGLDTEIPIYDQFTLGGFLNLSGFRSGQLRGQVVGFAQIVYFTRIGRLPGGLGEGIYLGGSLEAGNVWADSDAVEFSDLRLAASIFAGIDTVFGPLYVGYGRADGSEDSLYLFLGQSF